MVELVWKGQITDLGLIREREGRSGMMLVIPGGEIFVPLSVNEIRSLGQAGLLFESLQIKIILERVP